MKLVTSKVLNFIFDMYLILQIGVYWLVFYKIRFDGQTIIPIIYNGVNNFLIGLWPEDNAGFSFFMQFCVWILAIIFVVGGAVLAIFLGLMKVTSMFVIACGMKGRDLYCSYMYEKEEAQGLPHKKYETGAEFKKKLDDGVKEDNERDEKQRQEREKEKAAEKERKKNENNGYSNSYNNSYKNNYYENSYRKSSGQGSQNYYQNNQQSYQNNRNYQNNSGYQNNGQNSQSGQQNYSAGTAGYTEFEKAKILFMVDEDDWNTVTEERLKKIRNKLIKEFHPDGNDDEAAENNAKKINEAYQVLKRNLV